MRKHPHCWAEIVLEMYRVMLDTARNGIMMGDFTKNTERVWKL